MKLDLYFLFFACQSVAQWLQCELQALPTHSPGGAVNATPKQLADFHTAVTRSVTIAFINSNAIQTHLYECLLKVSHDNCMSMGNMLNSIERHGGFTCKCDCILKWLYFCKIV